MIRQVLAIARNTFVESVRQPIFFVLILLGGLAQVFNVMLSAYSMGFTESTEVFGDDKMLLDMGLATVMVCATLLAGFVATSVLSREIENKTALTVISKPVGRPLFIFGKYLGVSAAILVATVILLVFLMFAIRHRVMSTARDTVDGPVLIFATLGVLLPIGLAVWGNFFYGWVFTSTAVLFMLPTTLIGFMLALSISKEWDLQSLAVDFKPQIAIAGFAAALAVLVLTSVALAASTRLGQVMTLTVCVGVFVLGLLSNHFVGRHAFENRPVAMISEVLEHPASLTLQEAGDAITVSLETAPTAELAPGDSVYYGPTPSGLALAVPEHDAFTGELTRPSHISDPPSGPALVVSAIPGPFDYEFKNMGGLEVTRLPRQGDYVFTKTTKIHWPAWAAWGVIPNIQSFWLVDAITQGHKIPARYIAILCAYTLMQITAMLSLAVLLFQRRDVG